MSPTDTDTRALDTQVLQIRAQQGDLNAALMLLDTIPDDYTPRLVRVLTTIYGKLERQWKCVILPNSGGKEWFAIHADAARAILIAWRGFAGYAAAPAADGEEA